jgi:hypothetical protein
MRSRLLLVLLLALGALLAGCASGPRSVEISGPKLQAALDRRFPYETRLAGLIPVKVGVPRLRLRPEENRLALDFAVDATEPISRRAVHGDLAVSFGVRYQPSDASIRAVNVRVEKFALDAAPRELRSPLQAIGTLVTGNLLEGAVLHAFTPEELAQARGWTPQGLQVTPGGLRVLLAPPGTRPGP